METQGKMALAENNGTLNVINVPKMISSFEEDFHKCLVSDKPLYEAFLSMSRSRLPPDEHERYQRLRNSGFVMHDEADIDVYTHHVAGRHIPKFQWLYENLFRNYRPIFTSPIDLVVWGCGCGLDLIALYDQSMKEGNPNFWLVVQSITLIDISEPAMQRAATIAGLLFPAAEVKSIKVDLKNQEEVRSKVRLPGAFPYTPRVHLLSNIIDLFDTASAFAESTRQASARVIAGMSSGENRTYYNELFIAFSPDYKNGRVKANVSEFRKVWSTGSVDLKLNGEVPQNCEYAAFHSNSLINSVAYAKYRDGNLFLRRLVRGKCCSVEVETIIGLMRELCSVQVGGASFVDTYEYCEPFSFDVRNRSDDGKGKSQYVNKTHGALLCLTGLARHLRPCVILLEKGEDQRLGWIAVEKALLRLSGLHGNTEVMSALRLLADERSRLYREYEAADQEKAKRQEKAEKESTAPVKKSEEELSRERLERSEKVEEGLMPHHIKLLDFCELLRWNGEDGKVLGGVSKEGGAVVLPDAEYSIDYSPYFVIVPGDVQSLPALSPEQRSIADGRKQLRKIKGGPGVGKTVTMLWHALRAVQYTHLPVLILCKTISLISYNEKRLVATFLKGHPEQSGIDKTFFRFMTVDAFLCEYVKDNGECILRKCAKCLRRCSRLKVLRYPAWKLQTEEDVKRNEDIRRRFNCNNCRRSAEAKEVCKCLGCKGLSAEELEKRGSLPDEFLARSCDACKKDIVRRLKRRDRNRIWSDEVGSVLVDEAQILDPEYVKSVYNLTGAGNKWREFYLFCDAQQAFRHRALEQEDSTKKWVVKVPDTGFGTFDVLEENFRMKSRALIEACRIVQRILKGKDGEIGLFDWTKLEGDVDVGTGAFGIRTMSKVGFAFVEKEVAFLHETCGAESVTVICDEQSLARELSGAACEKDWIVTHLPKENYVREKRLRENFYEHPGRNHLTSVECAQGQSFETVVFILSSGREQFDEGVLELVFTALSRSGRFLRVIDASPKHWLYDLLAPKMGLSRH